MPSPSSSEVFLGVPTSLLGDLVEGRLYELPVADLRPHHDNDRLFERVDDTAQTEFEDDVREHGVEHPLLACGQGCASPRGTILRGHRRRAAALAVGLLTVPVLFLNDLNLDGEFVEMVRGNLADAHVRKLTEETKFRLEEEVRKAAGERRGRPSQDKSVGPNGIAGETVLTIAAKQKEAANAIRDRQKIFGSPCSTPELRSAVNGGVISRTAAAHAIREVEKAFPAAREGNVDATKLAHAEVEQILTSKHRRKPEGADSSEAPGRPAGSAKADGEEPSFEFANGILERAHEHLKTAETLVAQIVTEWGAYELYTKLRKNPTKLLDSVATRICGLATDLEANLIPAEECGCGTEPDCRECWGWGWLSNTKKSKLAARPKSQKRKPVRTSRGGAGKANTPKSIKASQKKRAPAASRKSNKK
jgi:hypothetical protein